MQKWEYCIIDGQRSIGTAYHPGYYRVTNIGFELVTDFSNRPKGVSESGAIGQLISQLGEEGWEMVGAGSILAGSSHILYFKRPLP